MADPYLPPGCTQNDIDRHLDGDEPNWPARTYTTEQLRKLHERFDCDPYYCEMDRFLDWVDSVHTKSEPG